MAVEEGDPGALKRNVLHLVLQHPEGVKFGDFSGAFQQLHGYHPQLGLHGYRSLKDLVADMKNVVAVEGDSRNPVIKVANNSDLYQWLEGGEENGWDDSDEKAQSVLYEEEKEEEEAEVVELVTSLLSTYKSGLRITKVQEFLLARKGVDLEKFSIAQGYKDTLEFLEHRAPELTIKYRNNRLNCIVQLPSGTAGKKQLPLSSSSSKKGLMVVQQGDPGALKRNVLHLVLQHPEGVKFGDFSGAFQQLHGYHPQLGLHGYCSLRHLLADMKNVVVLDGDSRNPVIKVASNSDLYQWLEGGEENGWDDSEEEAQSSLYDEATEEAEVVELLTSLLSTYGSGLKIKKVQEFLLAKNGVDLEKFSIARGYKDTLEFLERHRVPELTIKYQEKRLDCVVELTAGVAGKILPPLSNSWCQKVQHTGLTVSSGCPPPLLDLPLDSAKTDQNPEPQTEKNRTENRTEPPPSTNHAAPQPQGLMVVQQGDPGALKRNVLHLVLQHPEGVKFGDFSGAFQKLHGYRPQLGLHGYRSLRHLLADMKNVVVLDGDSQNPVIKVASNSDLHQWLEGGEENGWDDSEEEAQSVLYEEAADEEEADVSAPSPSAVAQSLVEKPASQAPGFSAVFVVIQNVLKCHPKGLKVKKLKEALREKYAFDLEILCSDLGYKDIVSFLQDIPGLLLLNSSATRNCVVQLQSGPSSPAPSLDTDFSACHSNATFQQPMTKKSGTHSPTPSLDTDFCSFHSNAIPQRLMTKKSDLAAALVLILDVLGGNPLGLNLKALKENLETKHGFDLDAFSQDLGYKDVMSFLVDIPGLCVTFQNGRQSQNCVIQLLSGAPVLPAQLLSVSQSLDKPLSSSGSNTLYQKPMERKPGSCISTSTQVSAPLSVDSKQSSSKSETSNQRKLEKKPALAEVLALLSSLLSSKQYQSGLRLKKVQELLLTKEGVDLEKFSIAQGHKDSLAFLECHMPELNIRYQEDRLNCVLQLGSGPSAKAPPPLLSAPTSSLQTSKTVEPVNSLPDSGVNSVPPLLGAPPPCIQTTNSVPVSHSSAASQFNASPFFDSERSANQSKTKTESMLAKKPGSCISTSTQVSAPLSVDSEQSSSKSETSNQRKLEKKPALAEVLALLSSLLSSKEYVLGLRLKKVQELLLTKEGVDLEKFSSAQGHKDSLAFLECHMPELNIRYQEDRLNCVLQLGSGPWPKTSPPLLCAPTSTKAVETVGSVPGSCISTSTQVSAPLSVDSEQSSSKSETSNQRKLEKKPALAEVLALLSSLLSSKQYQSGLRLKKVQELLLTKEGVDLEKFSIAQGHKDSLAFLECHMPELNIRYQEDRFNCVLQLGSAQLPSESQFHGPPPTEELPALSNAHLLRRSNLTGPQHSKDLDELKKEVACILARHPEGMSLFQFRAEYSVAYQKHLPLENASSAKQRLLQMPDVVCLKGYGVQMLLFPVSSNESSLKSGPQIISRLEDAAVVPGHSLSKAVTVADPVVVFQPSLPKAPVRPQPSTIHSLTSGHLSEPDKMESPVLLQSEMLRAPKPRALLQEHGVARAKLGDPSGQSFSSHAAEAAVAPGHSLSKTDPIMVPKSSAPKATMDPVPPPHSASHLYSECLKPLSSMESGPRPESTPNSSTSRRAGDEILDGFASKPTHLAKPWVSKIRTLTPSLSQHLPDSFMTWAQPVVFPPFMVLTQPVPSPSLASFQPVSKTLPTIQPQNVKSQSSHLAQAVPQMRPVQPTSPLQSTEQRNYVYADQEPGAFSEEQMSSRTVMHAQSLAPLLSVDGLPVSSPSRKSSQTIYQPEGYRHPWLNGPPRSSISAMDNSVVTTSSAGVPSQPAAYWSQSSGVNALVTSPSTPPSHLLPAPTSVPQRPSYVSRSISMHSDALPSSDLRVSPQPFDSQTLSISNRDPQAFKHPQPYVDVCSTISSVTTQTACSLTSPLDFPTGTPGQPSYTSYNPTMDYGAPNQMKPSLATSKEAEKQDNHYVMWADKKKPCLTQRPTQSYSSAFQNSPPPKSPGKCVIL